MYSDHCVVFIFIRPCFCNKFPLLALTLSTFHNLLFFHTLSHNLFTFHPLNFFFFLLHLFKMEMRRTDLSQDAPALTDLVATLLGNVFQTLLKKSLHFDPVGKTRQSRSMVRIFFFISIFLHSFLFLFRSLFLRMHTFTVCARTTFCMYMCMSKCMIQSISLRSSLHHSFNSP